MMDDGDGEISLQDFLHGARLAEGSTGGRRELQKGLGFRV